jgi:TolB-like protein
MGEGDDGNAQADSSAAGPPRPTVFLSYAAQDRPAAKFLRDALSGFGVEVWYDESELGGGEAWDQKIRRQIRECDYFMPVISAQTEARIEGYFRREWRLAVERTLDMADDHLFLLPVVIDETEQAVARVPERFLSVQWLRLPDGRSTPALESLCRRIALGEATTKPPVRRRLVHGRDDRGPPTSPDYPAFPAPMPGQKLHFSLAVMVWASRSAWIAFKRLPRWIRIIAVVWLITMLVSRGCKNHRNDAEDIPPATAAKLKSIAQNYQGSSNKADVAKLGAQIAREIASDSDRNPSQAAPLLAIPFIAPAGAAAADKLADSAFATVYGRLSVSRHGHVALAQEPLASGELGAALERGLALHSTYVLFGKIENAGTAQVLSIKIVSVEDRAVLWSKSYPVEGSDAAAIAAEVDSGTPSLDD